LFAGEFAGLLLEEQFESSFGQPLRCRGGDLLEGSEIHVHARPVVSEGSLRDDFGPLAGEIVELLEFLGCETWWRHGSSCLAVASETG
jgi:hypothetical protein